MLAPSGPFKHEVRHAIDVLHKGGTHLEQVMAANMLEKWWLNRGASPASEPAKVECVLHEEIVRGGPSKWSWECHPEPAQTEPVAAEMPEAVSDAIRRLENEGYYDSAEYVADLWRNAAQPANVRMTEELEILIADAVVAADLLDHCGKRSWATQIRDDVREVRAQVAEEKARG